MTQRFMVLDYETRSRADLKAVGGYEYSTHKSTDVMCVAWRIGTKDELRKAPTHVWSPFVPEHSHTYTEFVAALADESLKLVAHNAFFEQVITRNTLPKYAGQDTYLEYGAAFVTPHERWICTAARAAALALPRNLEGAAVVLNLPIKKDMDGRKLLLRMCKPKKPSMKDPNEWLETQDAFKRLIEYCRTDIAAEVELFLATPGLNPTEQKVWALDQKINMRGVYVDRHLVARSLQMIYTEMDAATEELKLLTGGAVLAVTQRDRLLKHLKSIGVNVPDLQADTVKDAIDSGLYTGDALRLLEIKRDVGKSSTAKYDVLWNRSATDRRVRDNLIYWGASTGRWAGAGVQFQNLPRGTIEDTTLSCRLVKDNDRDALRMLYGNLMDVLSSNIRGCVIATPGKELFCADYAAIEARVLFWVAKHEAGCEMFRQGADLYKGLAHEVYGTPISQITKAQRALGKEGILGCGYGMGAKKFSEQCAKKKIDLGPARIKTAKGDVIPELAQTIVTTYREVHHFVPTLWRNLEKAAVYAIQNPGKSVTVNYTKWFVKNGFLWCELPSGRRLAYRNAQVKFEKTGTKFKNGFAETKEVIYHESQNSLTKQWGFQKTWGGTLTENVVQAIARDLMAHAMLAIEAAGYEIILSVHDELVAERRKGEGKLEEFERLMATTPEWAKGCPVAVEGFTAKRYRK